MAFHFIEHDPLYGIVAVVAIGYLSQQVELYALGGIGPLCKGIDRMVEVVSAVSVCRVVEVK